MSTTITHVGIYHDTHVTRWQFDQLRRQHLDLIERNYYVGGENLVEFSNSQHQIKLATYHVPFPEETSWIDRFKLTYPQVKHTFIQCSELHEHTVNQLISLDLPNVTMFVCGFIDHEFKHARILPWMDWFISTAYFYKYDQPHLLNEKLISDHSAKPKKFDVLLGMKRLHRDFIYDYVTSNDLEDDVILTYFKQFNRPLPETDFILEEEGLEFIPDRQIRWSIDSVRYYGQTISLSQVVPINVYNQTSYSLVAETNFFNHFNFYTEKLVKPLMSKRLFIAVAGKNYLRNLRSLGFRTFDGVINETYDTVDDNVTRWTMAMDQLKNLCRRDPSEVYEAVDEIVEHNRRMILEKDWQLEMINQLKQILSELIVG